MPEIDFTQPFSNLYEIDFTQSFANLRDLDFEQPFINGFEFDFTQPFSNLRSIDFTQPFTHAVDKSLDFEQPFSNLSGNPYSFDFTQPFGHINIIDFKQPFPMAADQAFSFDFTQPFSNQAGTTKTLDFEQPFVNLNPQFKGFQSVYGSTPLSVTLSNGKSLGISASGLQISQDEGSPYWSCQFELTTLADYGLLTLNTAFTVNFYGTSYSFIVDTRPFRRSAGLRANEPQIQTGITGLSPLALLASPRAEPVTKTWVTDEKAKDIVQELIGSVTWNIPNWTIPANRFGVNNQAPLEAAQQIVQAAGGVIQSNPNGSVTVRSLYPVKVPNYESSIDTTLSDADISEISESISAQQYYNQFTIRDSDSDDQNGAGQDRLEFVADDLLELSGTVRAFPNPWRTNLQLTTTRADVSIAALNDGEAITGQITQEALEVKEGRASVQYPIMEIVSVEYLTTNLGGVAFDGSEISTAIPEWSLVNITYRYRYRGYRVTALEAIKAQFLLEET